MNDDTLVLPLMDALRVCLTEELAASPGGAVCFTSLVPGREVPADRCSCGKGDGCGGQAWVRVDSIYPSSVFPAQDSTYEQCSGGLVAVLELGVLRCLPQPQNAGGRVTLPDAGAITEATRTQLGDWRAMRCAVEGCWEDRRLRMLGRYQPVDSGDCGGGVLLTSVQLGRRIG